MKIKKGEKNMSVIRWIHPSVSSQITDNSLTFMSSQGTTKLFVVFTSARGVDNKIQLINSATEFVFFYGPPSIQHHGQVTYNIINWLNGGGGVYALRVLPDDAGFSNAILNIQTRMAKKLVFNYAEELVEVPDVTIRPTITYTNVNNTSQNTLEFDELRRSRGETIDGYLNNMIFAVTPRGRGSGYNNLGFRLTLTDHLDSTFDFRIYNFEVTQVTPTGGIETIEGPFQVAFDPDALSISGESMFIGDVIRVYSNFYDIIFNERQYEALGRIINPFVNPNRIDFISGQTRLILDQPETAFNELTGQEEDVHFYLHQYGTDHQWTGAINIIDSQDAVEQSIVNLDNDYRLRQYRRAERSVQRLHNALSLVRRITNNANPFANRLRPLVRNEAGGRIYDAIAELDSLYDALLTRKGQLDLMIPNPAYIPGGTEPEFIPNLVDGRDLSAVVRRHNMRDAATRTRNSINRLIDILHEGLDYARLNGESEITIDALVSVQNIEKTLAILQNVSLRFSSMLQAVSNMEQDFVRVGSTGVVSNIIDSIESVIILVVNTMNVLRLLEEPCLRDGGGNVFFRVDQADAILEEIDAAIIPIKNALEILRDPASSPHEIRSVLNGGSLNAPNAENEDVDDEYARNQLTDENGVPWGEGEEDPETLYNEDGTVWEEEDVDPYGAFTRARRILGQLRAAIELVSIEVNLLNLHDIRDILGTTAEKIREHLDDVIIPGSGDWNIDDIAVRIAKQEHGRLQEVRQNTFRNFLQNFDATIQLMFGSDGSIEIGSPNRQGIIDGLLARGYRGMIDSELLDPKQYPIDLVLDANYNVPVKNAIVSLCTEIRGDFMGLLDTGFQASAEQARNFRRTRLQVSNFRIGIFTQDFIIHDAEYTGMNIRVTSTFFLANKIPVNDNNHGIHWNFVGPRRGTISGFESMSFVPNAQWRENLYRSQINYIEKDPYRVRFNSQLTSQNMVTALSNIAAVRTLLRIQRDVERLMEDYKFEFNDAVTITAAQLNLNGYLAQWIANRACTSISGQVYSSEYDRKQKLLRVRIDMIFNTVIERIHIDLVVNS